MRTFNQHMSQAINKGVPANETRNLTELIARESGLNPNSKNPTSTAHGYGQFLNGTVRNYAKQYPNLNYNNPADQIVLTYKYAVSRYGSVEKALQYWDAHKWY
jgi:SLT domain-containing protein